MAFDPKRFFSLKTLLIALGGLAALIAIGAVAFIAFFPKDWAVQQVTQRIEQATGRQLSIAGKVDISFFPALGFSAEHVTMANAHGFGEDPFLAANRIVFAVKVLPLLHGGIEVKELILDGADVHLAQKANGSANWLFPTDQTSTQPTTLDDLKLDDVRVTDSRMTFTAPQGPPMTVESIDGALKLDSLDKPAQVDSTFKYRDQTVELHAVLALPRAMLEQGSTPLTAQVHSAPLDATFDGQFATKTGALTGALNAHGASLRDVMAWTGSPMAPGGGFGAYSVAANLAHQDDKYVFNGGTFKVDAITATGDVTVTMPLTGLMNVEGTLATPLLDVNPYMPAAQGQGGVQTSTAWDQTPIDFSGLKTMNAALNFTIGQLKFQRMTFSDAHMALNIANGVADARLSHIALYQGAGTARLVADASRATPRIAINLNVDNVQALPLLTDAIGFDKIQGRGKLVAALGGQGASQAAIMRSLAGTASFNFNDGAWRGVNLAQVARTVQSLVSGAQSTTTANSTDFAELSSSFTLSQGVAATQDLKMLNPLVRLDGAGLIDVGAQSIDMRISPRAVSSLQGQGGQANLAGLGVPFRISGPWSHVSFRPDLGDAIQQQLRARLGAAAAGQGADSPLGMLSGMFGGSATPATHTSTPTPSTATPATTPTQTPAQQRQDALRNALGGLFKGGN